MTLILNDLRDLFLGTPNFISKGSKYWSLLQNVCEKENNFTKDELEKFESIFNDMNAANWVEVENAFHQGFCAGAQLMAEVYMNKK